jgi:hypothetical protein
MSSQAGHKFPDTGCIAVLLRMCVARVQRFSYTTFELIVRLSARGIPNPLRSAH